jgi:hypothetical protein
VSISLARGKGHVELLTGSLSSNSMLLVACPSLFTDQVLFPSARIDAGLGRLRGLRCAFVQNTMKFVVLSCSSIISAGGSYSSKAWLTTMFIKVVRDVSSRISELPTFIYSLPSFATCSIFIQSGAAAVVGK